MADLDVVVIDNSQNSVHLGPSDDMALKSAPETGVEEAPDMSNRTVKLGTLVLLKIDPVASVADRQDATATAAAALLPKRRFLVFISRYHFTNHLAYTEPLGFDFLAVGREASGHSYASIGLSPASARHPAGRAPMRPSGSLPCQWDDCYIHTLVACTAIVTRIHLGPPDPSHVPAVLPVLPVWNARSQDLAKCHAGQSEADSEVLCAEHSAPFSVSSDSLFEGDCESAISVNDNGPSPSSSVGLSNSLQSLPHIRPTPRARRSATQSIGDAADSSCDRDSLSSGSSDLHLPDSWAHHADPGQISSKLRVRGEIWLDLAAFDDFDCPERLNELLNDLKVIEEDWTNRMALKSLAGQPRTREWVREVAVVALETGSTLDQQKPYITESAQADDEGLAPEDAIEHRMEGQLAE